MPSTLGSYKKLSAIFFGQKAVDFIQEKIKEAPNGEDEEVLADERQMIHLLANLSKQADSRIESEG